MSKERRLVYLNQLSKQMRIISGKHRGTKLYTLEGLNTRPTLDRVKEPLFSILQNELPEAVILDLFAGSGALGLEAISRGAQRAILCDNSDKAIHIIEQNVDKLKSKSEIQILKNDYLKALEILKTKKERFDIIFLDPPYNTDFAEKASETILQDNLLKDDGIIVIETDRKKAVMQAMNQLSMVEIYDERKYGRAELLFLRKKSTFRKEN